MQCDGEVSQVLNQEDVLICSGRYNWTAVIRKPKSKMLFNQQLILKDLKCKRNPDLPPVISAPV